MISYCIVGVFQDILAHVMYHSDAAEGLVDMLFSLNNANPPKCINSFVFIWLLCSNIKTPVIFSKQFWDTAFKDTCLFGHMAAP